MDAKVVTMPNLLLSSGARQTSWRVEENRRGARSLSAKLVETGSGAALYAVVDVSAGDNGFSASLAWYEGASSGRPARLDEIVRTGTDCDRRASWRSVSGPDGWCGRPLEAPRVVSANVDGLASLVRSIGRWVPCAVWDGEAADALGRRRRGNPTS